MLLYRRKHSTEPRNSIRLSTEPSCSPVVRRHDGGKFLSAQQRTSFRFSFTTFLITRRRPPTSMHAAIVLANFRCFCPGNLRVMATVVLVHSRSIYLAIDLTGAVIWWTFEEMLTLISRKKHILTNSGPVENIESRSVQDIIWPS